MSTCPESPLCFCTLLCGAPRGGRSCRRHRCLLCPRGLSGSEPGTEEQGSVVGVLMLQSLLLARGRHRCISVGGTHSPVSLQAWVVTAHHSFGFLNPNCTSVNRPCVSLPVLHVNGPSVLPGTQCHSRLEGSATGKASSPMPMLSPYCCHLHDSGVNAVRLQAALLPVLSHSVTSG